MELRVGLLIAEFLHPTDKCDGAGCFLSDSLVELFFVVAERFDFWEVGDGSAALCGHWCPGLCGLVLSSRRCVAQRFWCVWNGSQLR